LGIVIPLEGARSPPENLKPLLDLVEASLGLLRGEPHGRPRVKFVRVEEMLETLGEKIS